MSHGYLTYATREAAQEAADKIRTWPSWEIEQAYLPDNANADAAGFVWLVCRTFPQRMYLRADGTLS